MRPNHAHPYLHLQPYPYPAVRQTGRRREPCHYAREGSSSRETGARADSLSAHVPELAGSSADLAACAEAILARVERNFPHLKSVDMKSLVERIISGADGEEGGEGSKQEPDLFVRRGEGQGTSNFAGHPSVVTWGGGLSPLAGHVSGGREGAEAVIDPTQPLFSPRGRQFRQDPQFRAGGKQFDSSRQFSPTRHSPLSSPRRPAAAAEPHLGAREAEPAAEGGSEPDGHFTSKPSVVSWVASPLASPLTRTRGGGEPGGSAGVLDLEQMQLRADAAVAGAGMGDLFHSKPSVVSWNGSPLASPQGRKGGGAGGGREW